jgi:hypothetical protein
MIRIKKETKRVFLYSNPNLMWGGSAKEGLKILAV